MDTFEWLTVGEVAREVGVTDAAVRDRIRRRGLRVDLSTGHIRIAASEVAFWRSERSVRQGMREERYAAKRVAS